MPAPELPLEEEEEENCSNVTPGTDEPTAAIAAAAAAAEGVAGWERHLFIRLLEMFSAPGRRACPPAPLASTEPCGERLGFDATALAAPADPAPSMALLLLAAPCAPEPLAPPPPAVTPEEDEDVPLEAEDELPATCMLSTILRLQASSSESARNNVAVAPGCPWCICNAADADAADVDAEEDPCVPPWCPPCAWW